MAEPTKGKAPEGLPPSTETVPPPSASSSSAPPEASADRQQQPFTQLGGTIEVDEPTVPSEPPESPTDDEGFEDDGYSTGSTSLSSSVRDYTFENSRRYHKFKEGSYHFPNDEPEQEREDMKHAMVVHLCGGKLHYAPLDNPQKILDIGTGTGIWAIDMGDEYPEAEVIGLDLSPIQPQWVPPNVRFLVDDCEAEWIYPDKSIDMVHLRNMAPSVKDWPRMLEQSYKALKPGSWIELQEMRWVYGCNDGTMREDFAPKKMVALITEGLAVFGVEMNAAEKHPERVKEAGFVNVQHVVNKVPVGTWARDKNMKTIGMYCRSVIYDGLQAITIGPFTRGLKWTPEEVEVFLIKVRKDLMDPNVHSYVYYHSVIGQKPAAAR